MATLIDNPKHAAREQTPGEERYRLTMLNACSLNAHKRATQRTVPAEVDFILSALETARSGSTDRRASGRVVFRTLAELQLYSDSPGEKPWVLYTRDATTRGLGFITRHRLPLGYGGIAHVRGPNGEDLTIPCTVRRCHETVNGWFEGSLSFNREQWAFDRDNTSDAD